MRANCYAFGRYEFRPWALRDVSKGRHLLDAARIAGASAARAGPDDTATRGSPTPRATRRGPRRGTPAGVPYTLATMATRSIEEVAAASGDGRRWFQVYVWRDRSLVREMIERAAASGYEALVITVDTANLLPRGA